MSLDDTQSSDLINLAQIEVDPIPRITPCPGGLIQLKLDMQAASEHEAERFLVEKIYSETRMHTVQPEHQSSKTNERSI